MELILFAVSALPVVLVGGYIYKIDKNKEPWKMLLKLFLGGMFSIVLTLILSFLLKLVFPFFADETLLNNIELIVFVFIGVALIEEFSKWIMLYVLSYNDRDFDEFYDMIIYGVFVALGFAFFENLFYVYEGGIGTGILRAILTVPGHACDGVFMGYFLGLAKVTAIKGKKSDETKYKLLSLLVPVLLHGFYDYCLFVSNLEFIGLFLIFVILLFVFSVKKVKRVSKMGVRVRFKNRFCTNCGTPVKSQFCPNCGNENE